MHLRVLLDKTESDTGSCPELGVAASVTLRRLGRKYISFMVQFAGPIIFILMILLTEI